MAILTHCETGYVTTVVHLCSAMGIDLVYETGSPVFGYRRNFWFFKTILKVDFPPDHSFCSVIFNSNVCLIPIFEEYKKMDFYAKIFLRMLRTLNNKLF